MKTKVKLLILSLLLAVACNNPTYDVPQHIVTENAIMTSQRARLPIRKFKTQIGIFNQNKKFIKEASLSFRVETMDTAVNVSKRILNHYGGYISNENEHLNGRRKETNLTLKVPATSFDLFLDSLTTAAGQYESKYVNLRDVTEEYIDTESRLENKRQLESKYRDLLKKAKKVDELLAIEENLGKVREEIESAEKRFAALNRDIEYSKVNLQFFKLSDRNYYDYEVSLSQKFIRSISSGWKGMISFIFCLFSLWPLIIILSAGFYFFVRYRRKRKLKNA